MPKTKIILDCDPGCDDAVAMLLAWGSPAIDLVAVTTVGGNQTIDKVTRNALAVARVGNMAGLPVARGCARPIVRAAAEPAPEIHGQSGMDGPRMPADIGRADGRHGVQLIIDTVMQHPPKTITLVPTGPLTNIAMAARLAPAIVGRVKEVVLMGGAAHTGNRTACAEFNIRADPEAAWVVFHEDWPVTMVGLDVTHKARATPEVLAGIAALGTQPAHFVSDMIGFFARMYRQQRGFDAPPVHDACAVAYVIDPTIFSTRRVPVDVELTGTATLGMTVCDFRRPAGPECRTQVVLDLDCGRFWALVTDALRRIGEVDF